MQITEEEMLLLSALAMTEVHDNANVKAKGEIIRSLRGLAREIGEGIIGNRRGLAKEVVEVSLNFLEWAKQQKVG